ncbi:hypothetical protein [Candidatus Contendibacter odensensis]|uniref:Uncharacterized protein n=1 Tax=Candidatus Contendobacter odensis Run_B_J11 TaxID=1400861 RepID=A0A7U7J1U5_9GAMM|nr:hypothetical protein [Candidatus Contendobacter odensis]CDH43251.1 membrane hypothetical protein [Candidatus Contendobacter odensis Run_B_J11]
MTNYHTIIEIIGEFIGMGFGSLMNPFLWLVAIWLSIKDKRLQPIVLWSALVNAACWVVVMQTSLLYTGGPNVSIIFVFLATGFAGGILGFVCYLFVRIFKKPVPSNQEATSIALLCRLWNF